MYGLFMSDGKGSRASHLFKVRCAGFLEEVWVKLELIEQNAKLEAMKSLVEGKGGQKKKGSKGKGKKGGKETVGIGANVFQELATKPCLYTIHGVLDRVIDGTLSIDGVKKELKELFK